MGHEQRSQLIASLKGQTIQIPNLRPIFSGWPAQVNPHRDALVPFVDETLPILFRGGDKLANIQRADMALFASAWWPLTPLPQLRVLAYWAMWLIAWDDEVDEPTGAYSDELEAAQAFREETLQFVRRSLGLGTEVHEQRPVSSNALIEAFAYVGDGLREAYSVEQRQVWFDEWMRFSDMTQREQEIRLSGRIPSVKEYWEYRLGTSAVGTMTGLIDYAYGVKAESSILRDPDGIALSVETNNIVSLTNDMMSLKKEFQAGVIDNLIPLSYMEGKDVQLAITTATASLQASAHRFEAAASQLQCRKGKSTACDGYIDTFINACRYYCTGDLDWSLATPRYGVGKESGENGSVSVVL